MHWYLHVHTTYEPRPYMEVQHTTLWKQQRDQNMQQNTLPFETTTQAAASWFFTWQFGVIGTNVPEQDTKSVDVDRVVVWTSEEFRCHVDRGADYGTCHHGLRLGETKVRQCTAIVAIKLWGWEVWVWCVGVWVCDVYVLNSQVIYTCLLQIPFTRKIMLIIDDMNQQYTCTSQIIWTQRRSDIACSHT